MIFKWPKSLTNTYVVLLSLATLLLLLIASISYKHIRKLQESADWVSHTLEVDNKINELFSYYSLMEAAEFRSVLLRDSTNVSTSEDYKVQTEITMEQLAELTQNEKQHAYLDSVKATQAQLYKAFKALDTILSDSSTNKTPQDYGKLAEVSGHLAKLSGYKIKMLREVQNLMKARRIVYGQNAEKAPVYLLILSLFALGIFIYSFRKIYLSRQRILKTDLLMQSVLANSTNIISYFTPIWDRNDTLVDFKLEFTNHNIVETDRGPESFETGEAISKIYPEMFQNGAFELMKKCYEQQNTVINEAVQETAKGKSWYYNTYSPVHEGLHLTSVNITSYKNADLLIKKANKELESLNRELTIQNTVLKNAKTIAGLGSYSWEMKTDVYHISDNLYRLLDCEPNEFDPSLKNYRNFVHPDDLKLYDQKGEEALINQKSSQFTYRIITKLGKIKYVSTLGHFVNETNNTILVGVVQDVTKQMLNEQKLKNQNIALKQSNEELKSFNHVASHDLQEPLRKIQIFISRIMESNMDQLPDRTREYFFKIDDGAKRMQSLIRYLLAYSRLSNRIDKEGINLYHVVQKVVEDFSEQITEAGATVEMDKLPKVKAVPFQMEQLFGNLISNAIKYRKAGVAPEIQIRVEKLKKKDILEVFHKTARNYYRIAVIDNGIGFDNTKADKIFEIFQRLHPKGEYSGTGIGLAICKKIVLQHGGYIWAVAEKNKGASFFFYLPA